MVEETFDAAHALRGYEGPCENLHGHTWKVQVFLKGNKLNRLGMLEDFKAIKSEIRNAIAKFDHNHLNALKLFAKQNPTSENLAREIFNELKISFKSLSKVIVWESATTCASYFN